jgi:hypothetical protein
MGNGQVVFWSTAIPVTFVIMALAFLYGYKSDQILKYVRRKLAEKDAARQTETLNRFRRP